LPRKSFFDRRVDGSGGVPPAQASAQRNQVTRSASWQPLLWKGRFSESVRSGGRQTFIGVKRARAATLDRSFPARDARTETPQ